MMVVEVFASPGTLDAAQRRSVAERLIEELMVEDGAPEVVLDGARALTQVIVHEPAAMVAGGPEHPGARYLVRLTMPGSWNGQEMGERLIPRVTKVLAEFDDDPEGLYREPRLMVQLLGLKEGSVGAFGEVVSSAEITKLITKGFRESADGAMTAPPGQAIDPVCGMTVDTASAAITLDHEGTTYYFCAAVCKKVYAQELAGAGA